MQLRVQLSHLRSFSTLRKLSSSIANVHSPTICSNETHPDCPCHFSISFSGLYRYSLMSGIDKPDSTLFGADQECIQMSAMKTKCYFYPQMSKRLSEKIAAVKFTGCGYLRFKLYHLLSTSKGMKLGNEYTEDKETRDRQIYHMERKCYD